MQPEDNQPTTPATVPDQSHSRSVEVRTVEDVMEDNFLREEAIDHIIGSLKGSRMSDRMIGIREEGRVMVFNK